jgi:hypothetical protein
MVIPDLKKGEVIDQLDLSDAYNLFQKRTM